MQTPAFTYAQHVTAADIWYEWDFISRRVVREELSCAFLWGFEQFSLIKCERDRILWLEIWENTVKPV